LGYGVIGSTTGSGPVSQGSSPCIPARSRSHPCGWSAICCEKWSIARVPSADPAEPPLCSGLARRPLKAVAPVRIRSGVPGGKGVLTSGNARSGPLLLCPAGSGGNRRSTDICATYVPQFSVGHRTVGDSVASTPSRRESPASRISDADWVSSGWAFQREASSPLAVRDAHPAQARDRCNRGLEFAPREDRVDGPGTDRGCAKPRSYAGPGSSARMLDLAHSPQGPRGRVEALGRAVALLARKGRSA
jgi:hypothetical protein